MSRISNYNNISILLTARQPFQDLQRTHLRYCAEDVAMVFCMYDPGYRGANNIRPEFSGAAFMSQLIHVRTLNATKFPSLPMPSDHPYSLAAIQDPEAFLRHCARLEERGTVDNKTPFGKETVRKLVLENSSEALHQVSNMLIRLSGSIYGRKYMVTENALKLIGDDQRTTKAFSGIDLHARINKALDSLGLEPYPDIISSPAQPRPSGPVKLQIV